MLVLLARDIKHYETVGRWRNLQSRASLWTALLNLRTTIPTDISFTHNKSYYQKPEGVTEPEAVFALLSLGNYIWFCRPPKQPPMWGGLIACKLSAPICHHSGRRQEAFLKNTRIFKLKFLIFPSLKECDPSHLIILFLNMAVLPTVQLIDCCHRVFFRYFPPSYPARSGSHETFRRQQM